MPILPGSQQVPNHQPRNAKRFLKKTRTRRLNYRNQQRKQNEPVGNVHSATSSSTASNVQLAPSKPPVRFNIFLAGLLRHFRRKRRRRRLLVPANLFQVISHVLLVEGWLRCAWFVSIRGPKTR